MSAEDSRGAWPPAPQTLPHGASGRPGLNLYRDAADPWRFVEVYQAASWDVHLRQHEERTTEMDRRAEEPARSLTAPGEERVISHLLSAGPASVRRARETGGRKRLIRR